MRAGGSALSARAVCRHVEPRTPTLVLAGAAVHPPPSSRTDMETGRNRVGPSSEARSRRKPAPPTGRSTSLGSPPPSTRTSVPRSAQAKHASHEKSSSWSRIVWNVVGAGPSRPPWLAPPAQLEEHALEKSRHRSQSVVKDADRRPRASRAGPTASSSVEFPHRSGRGMVNIMYQMTPGGQSPGDLAEA
jgi:hypothetical protein